MAFKISENFVCENLKPGTVFEFGCSPGVFTAKLGKEYTVTGIDLYPPEFVNNYSFIRGDVLDMPITSRFDNIVCLSSFEHCGVETADFKYKTVDYSYHVPVAKKLVSLLKEDGRIILTVPFGNNGVFFVTKSGANYQSDVKGAAFTNLSDPVVWGFRTFIPLEIELLFSPLRIIKYKVFKYKGKGDLIAEVDCWSELSIDKYMDFDNVDRKELMVVLEESK